MNSEKNAIRILSVTAVLLLSVLLFVAPSAPAQVAAQQGDYLMATFPAQTGDDAVYVADTRHGMVCVFVYDSSAKALRPRAVQRISEGFGRF